MPLETALIPAEDRLDLILSGRLDLTLTPVITDLLEALPADLRTCIVDLTRVALAFDSGLALLWLLDARLNRQAVTLVVVCDDPVLLQQLPVVMPHASLTIPQDTSASGAPVGHDAGGHGRHFHPSGAATAPERPRAPGRPPRPFPPGVLRACAEPPGLAPLGLRRNPADPWSAC